MPEGFHSTSPDATSSVRRADVPAEVRAYADNLMLQLDEIVARYGFRDFRAAMETPDDERHAGLEAVMDMKDLERYQELIVGYRDAVTKRRIPAADRDWKRRQAEARAAESVREAVEAMGVENVLGPDAAAATFGLDLESLEIPSVPFSRAELERAKELNQLLVFRVDKTADGQPLSMKKMSEALAPRFSAEGKGVVLSEGSDWCEFEPFFKDEVPAAGWALVSRESVPNMEFKDFLQQTVGLINYLRNEAFKGVELPRKYTDAIAQFETAKTSIASLLSFVDGTRASKMLEALEITSLVRPSPAEATYDAMLAYDHSGTRPLQGAWTWTSRRCSDGRIVRVGYFDLDGFCVNRGGAARPLPELGAVFARR